MSGSSILLSNAFTRESLLDPMDLKECEKQIGYMFKCPGRIQNISQAFYVQKVYPPVIETESRFIALACVFLVCFVVCLSGNVSVLTMIHGILKTRRRTPGSQTNDHTIIYISALCVVDIFISLSLPTAITDNLLGFWMFGRILCKLHHLCGSVGRIASTFLITAITFDRYVAVCHPHKLYRTRGFVYAVITGVVIAAIVLLLPLLIYSDTNEYVIHDFVAEDGSANRIRVRVFKCADTMPRAVFFFFTYSTFTLGFLAPLSLILYFDYKLLKRLYHHIRELPQSAIPLRRILRYTLVITVVYFCGWTPYWWSVLYGSYHNFRYGEQRNPDDSTLFFIYVLHTFPYLAVATNWIFYGLLNTQLQRRDFRRITHFDAKRGDAVVTFQDDVHI